MSRAPVEWDARCERIARGVTRGYFPPPGTDWGDLLQEARFGVWQAMLDYEPDRGDWYRFAELVARRRLVNYIRAATRHKRYPEISDASLDEEILLAEDAEVITRMGLIEAGDEPLQVLIDRQHIRQVLSVVNELSPREREALVGVRIQGRPYSELPGTKKQVDNDVQRAARKLKLKEAA